MESHSRLLIINADDFGYNDAITQGILMGFREGVITTTSAMVNIPGAPERIAAAHASDPTLPIGLHLNIATGRPVLPAEQVPHLIGPDGYFLPVEAFLPRNHGIPMDEIRAEAVAQAELLIQSGVVFDHIDYHQHIFALNDTFFEVVAEMVEQYRVPIRQPIVKVLSGRFFFGDLRNVANVLKVMVGSLYRNPRYFVDLLPILSAYQRRGLIAERLGAPDWFISAFFGNPTLENFFAILRQLPPGLNELMVHPALEASELYTMEEDYRAERPRELAVLLDPRARAEIDRLAIHMTDFSAAKNPRPLFDE